MASPLLLSASAKHQLGRDAGVGRRVDGDGPPPRRPHCASMASSSPPSSSFTAASAPQQAIPDPLGPSATAWTCAAGKGDVDMKTVSPTEPSK
eukprot:scaffold26504_cov56-Phaeocystis_antarctica.AAC.4